MILNCPACSAKYQIADGAIPVHGRNVRCAACGHFWFQKPEAGLSDNVQEPTPANDSPLKQEKKKGFGLPTFTRKKTIRAPHETVRKKALDKIIISQAIGIAAGWILAFGIIWAGLFFAVQNRNEIVQKWPKSASAFAFFGVPANLYGLEIKSVMVRAGSDIVGPRIIVSGVVKSVSKTGKQVPYLRVTLVDEKGTKKDSWMVDPQTIYLEPNAFQAFATLRRNPPKGNIRAIVTFAEPPPKVGVLSANAKSTANSVSAKENAAPNHSLAGADNSHNAPSKDSHAPNGDGAHDAHAPTTALGR